MFSGKTAVVTSVTQALGVSLVRLLLCYSSLRLSRKRNGWKWSFSIACRWISYVTFWSIFSSNWNAKRNWQRRICGLWACQQWKNVPSLCCWFWTKWMNCSPRVTWRMSTSCWNGHIEAPIYWRSVNSTCRERVFGNMNLLLSLMRLGIANSLDLTDRLLPRLQLQPEHKPYLLRFSPYNREQMLSIVNDR